MSNEKIYKSLTKGEVGVYQGTHVDEDGAIKYTLLVNKEKRVISESTFKRWWKLVEETTPEDVKESVETLEKAVKPATMEELKEVNTEGEDITTEEIEQFKETVEVTEQPTEEATESTDTEETTEQKKEKSSNHNKKSPKDNEGVADFFQKRIYEKEGSFAIYSEPAKRVVKDKTGKTVMFYMIKRNCGIKLYMPEPLDEVIAQGANVEEKHTYPKQYPYRLEVTTLDDKNKDLLDNILQLYI